MSLGVAYWREIEHLTRGLYKPRTAAAAWNYASRGADGTLLRFGTPQLCVTTAGVSTTYLITGGLLARLAAGSITLSMHSGAERVEWPSSVTTPQSQRAPERVGHRSQSRAGTCTGCGCRLSRYRLGRDGVLGVQERHRLCTLARAGSDLP